MMTQAALAARLTDDILTLDSLIEEALWNQIDSKHSEKKAKTVKMPA